jgi:hypothetical protein
LIFTTPSIGKDNRIGLSGSFEVKSGHPRRMDDNLGKSRCLPLLLLQLLTKNKAMKKEKDQKG